MISDVFMFLIIVVMFVYLILYFVLVFYSLKFVWMGEIYDEIKGLRVWDGFIVILVCIYFFYVIIIGMVDLMIFIFGIGLFFVGLLLYFFVLKKFVNNR